MKEVFVFLVLILHLNSLASEAQTNVPVVTQKGDKTLVSVPVTVSDREGRYIPNLKKDDFTLYQDGVEQKIAFFGKYEEPINVALLIDTSESTKTSLDEIKNAAGDFVGLLNPADRALIATFDSELKILNSFTSDRQILTDSLGKIRPAERDGSILLSAVEQVAQKPFANLQNRKIIVLLSDGKDF